MSIDSGMLGLRPNAPPIPVKLEEVSSSPLLIFERFRLPPSSKFLCIFEFLIRNGGVMYLPLLMRSGMLTT